MNKTFKLNSLIRKNVASLKPYSSARDEFKDFKKDMIFLDANENPYSSDVNRYPDPHQTELKLKLSGIKEVLPDNILLGNGSDEVLDLIFRAFCEPGIDNCITMPPTYGMYKVLAGINNIENKEVLLNHYFEPAVKAILNEIDENTKLIFICSPNNPTGNIVEREKIKKILDNFNGLVVLDEAYINFSLEKSWVSELKNYPNLVVTQTFSKAMGMAGIRLGVSYASAEIVQVLNKIKAPYNINHLSEQRALIGLDNQSKINSQISEIQVQKKILSKVLLDIKFILKVYKSEANFFLVETDNANKRYQQLLDLGIVVRNRTKQVLCENCLRISVGTPKENKQLLSALKKLDT